MPSKAEPSLEVRPVDLAPAYLPHRLEVVQEAQVIQIDRVLGGFLRMGNGYGTGAWRSASISLRLPLARSSAARELPCRTMRTHSR